MGRECTGTWRAISALRVVYGIIESMAHHPFLWPTTGLSSHATSPLEHRPRRA